MKKLINNSYIIPNEVTNLTNTLNYRATIAVNRASLNNCGNGTLDILIEDKVLINVDMGLVSGIFSVSNPDQLSYILLRSIKSDANSNEIVDNLTHIYSEKYKHTTATILINNVIFECVSVTRYKSEQNKFTFIGILDEKTVKILKKED